MRWLYIYTQQLLSRDCMEGLFTVQVSCVVLAGTCSHHVMTQTHLKDNERQQDNLQYHQEKTQVVSHSKATRLHAHSSSTGNTWTMSSINTMATRVAVPTISFGSLELPWHPYCACTQGDRSGRLVKKVLNECTSTCNCHSL